MHRKGTFSDCRAIYELICDMENKRLPFDIFSSIYQKQLQNINYSCIVYELDCKVCGVLNLRFEEQLHHTERIAEILEFAVDASHRDKGIGKELLVAACQISKNMGCTQIEADCNKLRLSAHGFYVREGMHNFHYKFSKRLIGIDTAENKLGK